MTGDTAARLATTAGGMDGVQSVIVCDAAGELAGANRHPAPERGAVLVRFLLARAKAAAGADDMRGLGRTVGESRLHDLVFGGPRGEGILLATETAALFAVLDRGASAASVAPLLAAAVRRYAGATS